MPNQCVYCEDRTGKRECPALGGYICSRCCGEHRGSEIKCPADCRYFQKHEQYQQSKEADPYREAWVERNQDLLQERQENKEVLDAMAIVESLVYYRYEVKEDNLLEDHQVLEGLEGLQRKLKPIEVPGANTELQRFFWSNLEGLLNENRVDKDSLSKALERLLDLGRDFTDESRRLVQGIVGRVREDFPPPEEPEEDEEGLIFTPEKLARASRRSGRGGPNSQRGRRGIT